MMNLLNSEGLPLMGSQAAQDEIARQYNEQCLLTSLSVISEALSLTYAELQQAEFGSAQWIDAAHRFARYILATDALNILAHMAAQPLDNNVVG